MTRPSPTVLLDTAKSQEITLEAEYVVQVIRPNASRMTFEDACQIAREMTAAGCGVVGIFKLSAITEPGFPPPDAP